MKIFEGNLLKKMSLALFAGAVFAGTGFAADNAKAKSLVNPEYYDEN